MKKVNIYKFIKKDYMQVEKEEDYKSLDEKHLCFSIYRLISNSDGSSQYRAIGVVLQSSINTIQFNPDGTLADINGIGFQAETILVYDFDYEEE